MNNIELKKIVDKYFFTPPVNMPKWLFSKKWKTDVYEEVKKGVKSNWKENDVVKIIGHIHIKLYQRLLDDLKAKFKSDWKNLPQEEVDDIVIMAWTKFATEKNNYDPAKGKNEFEQLCWRVNYDFINNGKKQ